jgi:peptidoglycan L-alanyl-D-glutamate endopeptidase CwlK
MKSFTFGQRSEFNLEGVHHDLVAIARRALQITAVDFMVVDGLRTLKEQKVVFETGASETMNSRHLTGHAIDVAAFVGGKISWQHELYEQIADAFKTAALELKIPLIWGGDWKHPVDGGHFELDRRKYPA